MRTQPEILSMIDMIHRSGTDPVKVQVKTLFRKLEWKHAQRFIVPEKRTEEQKAKHESMNSLDEQQLEKEMAERIEQLFEFVSDAQESGQQEDLMRCHIHLQMILVYLWLMGKKRDDLFRWLFRRMSWENMNHRAVARHLAEEFEVNWHLMELRYP